MALDFTGLQTEVIARGFDWMAAGAGLTRLKRWINDAMHTVDREERWPYRLTTTTATMPQAITDLGALESVVDVARDEPLVLMRRLDVLEATGDLTTAGTPAQYAYRTTTGVAIWPVNTTASFLTSYYKVAADLSAGTDVPLMPDEYRMIVVELACRAAYRDSGAYEAAADCQAAANEILASMRVNLLDWPEFVPRTEPAQDD